MCDSCDWESYDEKVDKALELIEDLPEEAEEFGQSVMEKLESMQMWMQDKEHVTEKMKSAVDNMCAGLDNWMNR